MAGRADERREEPEKKGAKKGKEKKEKPDKKEKASKKAKNERDAEPEKSEKAEKAEKADKKEKAQKAGKLDMPEPEKKERKPRPALTATLVVNGLWLFLLAALAFFLFLDLFSLRQIFLQILNPEMDYTNIFADEIAAVQDQTLALDMRALTLDELELQLSELEGALRSRERDLDDREQLLAEKYPWADTESAQEGGEPIDISVVVKSIEKMDPARAAEAFVNMSDQDLGARLLSQCKAAQSGAILSAMTAENAAAFIERMGTPP